MKAYVLQSWHGAWIPKAVSLSLEEAQRWESEDPGERTRSHSEVDLWLHTFEDLFRSYIISRAGRGDSSASISKAIYCQQDDHWVLLLNNDPIHKFGESGHADEAEKTLEEWREEATRLREVVKSLQRERCIDAQI